MGLSAMLMYNQLQDWIQFSCLQECPVKTAFDRKVYTFLSLWLLHQTVFEVHVSLKILTLLYLKFFQVFLSRVSQCHKMYNDDSKANQKHVLCRKTFMFSKKPAAESCGFILVCMNFCYIQHEGVKSSDNYQFFSYNSEMGRRRQDFCRLCHLQQEPILYLVNFEPEADREAQQNICGYRQMTSN